MGRSGFFTPLWQFSMYNNHFGNQNKYKILAKLLQPLCSLALLLGCYFFPQNISLLPKIVTEGYANLKKKKTSCNTTLKHNMVMQS